MTADFDDQANAGGELQGSGPPSPPQGADFSGVGNTATSNEGSTATTTAQIRSERSGLVQSGRHYTISVMCSEATAAGTPMPNDSGMAMLTVTVPHDQGTHG